MIAKSFLFAAVTSTLLLLVVLPSLPDLRLVPVEIARIASLSVASMAIGGLTAETLAAKLGPRFDGKKRGEKKYIACLATTLLLFAIVAPSVPSSLNPIGMASIGVLSVLSLSLGGLVAEGAHSLLTGRLAPEQDKGSQLAKGTSSTPDHQENDSQGQVFDGPSSRIPVPDLLSRELEARINEMEARLLEAIQESGREVRETKDHPKPSSPSNDVVKQSNPSEIAKASVVDALLGKPGRSGAK